MIFYKIMGGFMNKELKKPEIEIIKIDNKDIIVTSPTVPFDGIPE